MLSTSLTDQPLRPASLFCSHYGVSPQQCQCCRACSGPMDDDWITLLDAAAILGRKPGNLRTWKTRGAVQGPRPYKFGTAVMYKRHDVLAWKAAQESDTAAKSA
jgi:hypothetical protein